MTSVFLIWHYKNKIELIKLWYGLLCINRTLSFDNEQMEWQVLLRQADTFSIFSRADNAELWQSLFLLLPHTAVNQSALYPHRLSLSETQLT